MNSDRANIELSYLVEKPAAAGYFDSAAQTGTPKLVGKSFQNTQIGIFGTPHKIGANSSLLFRAQWSAKKTSRRKTFSGK